MTASEASRAFSSVLDAAERGETIVITRAGRRIATISGAGAPNWGAFRSQLASRVTAADPEFESDLCSLRDSVSTDEDPWQTA